MYKKEIKLLRMMRMWAHVHKRESKYYTGWIYMHGLPCRLLYAYLHIWTDRHDMSRTTFRDRCGVCFKFSI